MKEWFDSLTEDELHILDKFSSTFTNKGEWDLIAKYIAL